MELIKSKQGIYFLYELIDSNGAIVRLTNNAPIGKNRQEIYVGGQAWLCAPIEIQGIEKTTDPVGNITIRISIPPTLRTPFRQAPLLNRGNGIRRIVTDASVLDKSNYYIAGLEPPESNPVPLNQRKLEQDSYSVQRITDSTQNEIVGDLQDLTASWSHIFRPMVPDRCYHTYRDSNCGYTGTNYFDINGNPVLSREEDVCGLSIRDCEKRYPPGDGEVALPFGGIPPIILNQEST